MSRMTAHGNLPEPVPADQGVKAPPGVQVESAALGTVAAPQERGRRTVAKGAILALGLLIGINLFNYIDRQILSANVTNIKADFKAAGAPVSEAQVGLLATAFMVAYMVFAPLFGWLADRMGRWHLIGIGVILWSLASGASGLSATVGGLSIVAGSYYAMLLTRCFVGVGEAAYGPLAPTVISDMYPVEKRGQVLAWFYVAIPVGSALGYTFGGLLGWPWSFYWVVPPGIALGLWCFFMPEPPRGQADIGASVRHVTLKDYLLLLKNRSYVLDTLGMAGMTFALGGIAVWMPDYIYERLWSPDPAWSADQLKLEKDQLIADLNFKFGLIVVVSGLAATILGGLAGDWLRPKYSGSYFLVSGVAMLVGFPLFLTVLYSPFPLAWVLIFLACFCLFFNTGPSNTILANVTHPSLRAPAFALNILVIHLLGDAFSPYVIGFIKDATPGDPIRKFNAGFLAVSVMILLGGVLWIIGAKFLARDTANAPKQLDD
jgi:MFS family permease